MDTTTYLFEGSFTFPLHCLRHQIGEGGIHLSWQVRDVPWFALNEQICRLPNPPVPRRHNKRWASNTSGRQYTTQDLYYQCYNSINQIHTREHGSQQIILLFATKHYHIPSLPASYFMGYIINWNAKINSCYFCPNFGRNVINFSQVYLACQCK